MKQASWIAEFGNPTKKDREQKKPCAVSIVAKGSPCVNLPIATLHNTKSGMTAAILINQMGEK